MSGDIDPTRDESGVPTGERESSPPKPGVAVVDGNPRRRTRLQQKLGDRFRILPYESPQDAREHVDSSVAVLLVVAEFESEDVASLIDRTRQVSQHVEVAIVSRDSGDLIDLEVVPDETLTSPLSWSDLEETIERLRRRAMYSATLKRYFQATLAANNLRIARSTGELAADEQYRHLEEEIGRLKDRLDEFTEAMDPEDYADIIDGFSREKRTPEAASPRTNPAMFGLPEQCPDCGLAWGEWHGSRLGHGYEMIAAFVWRCTKCNYVISNPDPNVRYVGP